MKTIKKLQILAFILLLISCSERIDLNLENSEPKLVVDAKLSTEQKAHKIKLTQTTSYFNTEEPPTVSGATISISDGKNTFNLTEDKEAPGNYYTAPNVKGEIGKTYTLTIKNVDINKDGKLEEYSATSEMKDSIPIKNLTIKYDEDEGYWNLFIDMKRPPQTRNYFLFKKYRNKKLSDRKYEDFIVFSDEFFSKELLKEVKVAFFDSGKERVKEGDFITLELQSITKDYYEHIRGGQEESSEGSGVFSGPASNIHTNLSNGAIGFFATYSFTRASAVFSSSK